MIRILGIRRIALLAILIGLNLAFGVFYYLYLFPHTKTLNMNLQTMEGENGTREADISRMQVEYDEIQREKTRFQTLANDGFFRDQSRREAEDLFKRIQISSGVLSAVVNIGAGKMIDNVEAAKASYKVLESPVRLTIEALDDIDIYRYLYMMQRNFPGYLTYETFQMQRIANVDATVLRGVATGKNVPLVKADIQMTWQTMIPDQKPVDPATAPGGPAL